MALLGLIFTGLLVAGFAIVESLEVLKVRANIQEEGNFILAKTNWVLSGSAHFLEPAISGNTFRNDTQTLSWVSAADGYLYYNGEKINSQNFLITQCGHASSTIPLFTHTGGAADAEKIDACFNVKTRTPTGKVYSQEFKITSFLRK